MKINGFHWEFLENILTIRLVVLTSPALRSDICKCVFMIKCVVPIEKITRGESHTALRSKSLKYFFKNGIFENQWVSMKSIDFH